MKRVLVVCDNTMGIPGKEIDDGLALLYLLGLDDVHIEGICCTHGNSTTENTFDATQRLVAELGLDVPVLRGADAPSEKTGWLPSDFPARLHGEGHAQKASEAAQFIANKAEEGKHIALLSLGAVTDLAAAERLRPGCLARYRAVALMGGITHTLVVGGHVMNELNFSVDGQAASDVFATARSGAELLLADAWHCLPLLFKTNDFKARLVAPGFTHSTVLERYCVPWMEHARTAWDTDGFVGWDVLAAIALVQPDLVKFEPFEVACNPRLLSVGYLERAQASELAAPISLVGVPDGEAVCEQVYRAWEAAAVGYMTKSG